MGTIYVGPNHQRPLTQDRRFREALWLAIDKPALIRAGWAGRAAAAASLLPAQMWGLDTTLKDRWGAGRARDPGKASGYDGRALQFFVINEPQSRRQAELLQADWARIGVKVGLRAMEPGEMYTRSGRGEHDLVLAGWYSDNGDPDNFFSPNVGCAAVAGGANVVRWCNAAFDTLLQQRRRGRADSLGVPRGPHGGEPAGHGLPAQPAGAARLSRCVGEVAAGGFPPTRHVQPAWGWTACPDCLRMSV
jgi:dipeptide transport system substrate-binding protein